MIPRIYPVSIETGIPILPGYQSAVRDVVMSEAEDHVRVVSHFICEPNAISRGEIHFRPPRRKILMSQENSQTVFVISAPLSFSNEVPADEVFPAYPAGAQAVIPQLDRVEIAPDREPVTKEVPESGAPFENIRMVMMVALVISRSRVVIM